MTMPAINKEKCICQICICGEHRCEFSRSSEGHEIITKTEGKIDANNDNKIRDKESDVNEENQCNQQKCRKQWETSPDQIKEITRSLSKINGSHLDKRDDELINKKSNITNKSHDNQVNRPLLPPINILSDSDSGKEQICICEGLHQSNSDLQSMDQKNNAESQWVVTRPKRTKPRDNLCLEGSMDLKTTVNATYDSTAKQINDNLSKNVAIVVPSSQLNSEENFVEKQRQTKINNSNAIKSSKKKSKHRPSTSLRAGGDGYFNTISKESYKNFVIINDNSKMGKVSSSCNNSGKKSSVCCTAVANIKLPKVDTNNKEEKLTNRRQSKELNSIEVEQINRSMHKMTTEDKVDSTNHISHQSQTNIQSSAETQSNVNGVKTKLENSKQKLVEKTSENNYKFSSNELENVSNEGISWTIGSLEEHKRVVTRDVDNIKELGILDAPNGQSIRPEQIKTKDMKPYNYRKMNSNIDNTNGSTKVRIESKHYIHSQRRQKKHKNESSVKLFQGDMDFSTTNKTCFADHSPNRSNDNIVSVETERRQHTAGKRTRKSGRNANLFRTSTEADFFCHPNASQQPNGQKSTYQNQFNDRLYCPALDLGSNKSDFKYKGESSGHKFYLPAVKY